MQTRMAQRFVFALVALGTLSLSAWSASEAFATGGSSGLGGGAFVGDTVVATAWESTIDPFAVLSSPEVHTDEPEIYNYRIGLPDQTIIDYQSTAGLSPLTEAEQEQWYIDSGLAPYEFTWTAFYCPKVRILTPPEPIAVDGDPGIDLPDVLYRDIPGAVGYPTFSEGEFDYWVGDLLTGTVFSGDLNLYVPEFQSTVATPLLFDDSAPSGTPGPIAASYINITCPDGYAPYFGRLLESSTEGDYAIGRSLTIGSSLYIEPALGVTRVAPVIELSPANTYIAVTGDQFNVNAALWGVTRVNTGSRALPDTGQSQSWLWGAAIAAGLISALGTVLLVRSRMLNR